MKFYSFFELLQNNEDLLNLRQQSALSGLVTPRYEGQSISNIPDTIAKLLQVKGERPLKEERFYNFADTRPIENVVFLLLDGFGCHSIENTKEQFGFPSLEKIESRTLFLPLTSVFPSTTSTATTTLHTGLTPQEHGVIGYTMYLNEVGAIVQMLDFGPVFSRKSLFELGFDPAKVIGKRTIHEKLRESGISSNLYVSKYIVNSGLSQVTNRGANVIPILTAPDLFIKLRKNLESSTSSPNFHFAYFATPDTIAHTRGPFSQEYAAEIESIFYVLYRELFEKLDHNVARKTLLMISADHGLSHVNENEIVDVANHQELIQMLKVPPTGDSRSIILHAKSEEKISEIEEYFDTKLAGMFRLMRSREALKMGLFGTGEIRNAVFDRVGDLIAVPEANVAMDNSNVQPRNEYVPGRHGGLSQEEMIVPLITSRLS